MNFILLIVNIFLLLQFTGASPVNCNTTLQPYCCSPPHKSLSIPDLFNELTDVIDLLEPACENSTFKKNVSWYITVLLYIYLYMHSLHLEM